MIIQESLAQIMGLGNAIDPNNLTDGGGALL
jgi:hypothetical protein